MSFGTAATGENDPLALGAETLWRSGITVVASAGNAGPQNGTITSPGCCSEIITVGAIGGGDRPFVPDFSSRGKTDEGKPELVAPGVDVTCCGTTKNYITLSGTSMAAPVVAGYCANILARHPSYTPDKIKEILVNSAKPLPLPPEAVGYGEARLLPEYL